MSIDPDDSDAITRDGRWDVQNDALAHGWPQWRCLCGGRQLFQAEWRCRSFSFECVKPIAVANFERQAILPDSLMPFRSARQITKWETLDTFWCQRWRHGARLPRKPARDR